MSSTSTTLTETQLGSGIRIRRPRRSSASTRQHPQPCPNPLSGKFEQIDFSSLSPAQALAFLRFLVLSYLADLEASLAQLESVDLGITEALKAKGELTIDEAKQRVCVALQMLEGIRAGVSSHLPEVHFADMTFETLVKSHLPDVSEMRSHLPDMHIPSLQGIPALARHASKSAIPEVRSHLPDFDFADVRSKLDDVRTRIHDLDFHKPLSYIPVLSDHLQSLQLHLSAMAMELPSSALLSDLMEALLSSDLLSEFLPSAAVISDSEDMLERAANQVAEAVKRSLGGAQLIRYVDLPDKWKNNPFVAGGYR
jgi:adiponectin receptor